MKNYLFYDYETGENFIVETDMKEKAYLCAYKYFKDPKFISEISYFEAEMLGLDTYQLCVRLARAPIVKKLTRLFLHKNIKRG